MSWYFLVGIKIHFLGGRCENQIVLLDKQATITSNPNVDLYSKITLKAPKLLASITVSQLRLTLIGCEWSSNQNADSADNPSQVH